MLLELPIDHLSSDLSISRVSEFCPCLTSVAPLIAKKTDGGGDFVRECLLSPTKSTEGGVVVSIESRPTKRTIFSSFYRST